MSVSCLLGYFTYQYDRGDDSGTTCRPHHLHNLVFVIQHQGRRHGGHRTLSRGDEVRFRGREAVSVDDAGRGEVIHLIVEDDPCACARTRGSETVNRNISIHTVSLHINQVYVLIFEPPKDTCRPTTCTYQQISIEASQIQLWTCILQLK